ncbi:MAG: hypothetical protein KDA37_16470 [Planctomycetales bacterium]|nr:hypothetical protein [Planctomycetales bacterium]
MALLTLVGLRRSGRSPTLAIITAGTLLIGGATAIGARLQLDNLLAIAPGADIDFVLDDVVGDCGTPSVYVLPETGDATTDYVVMIDFLGGANRFPQLGSTQDATPVLVLPEDRPPGVGLGRGLPASCQTMSLTLSGGFDLAGRVVDLSGAGNLKSESMASISFELTPPGAVTISYARPEAAEASAALAAFRLTGVADLWQYAYKRVGLINRGMHDVNVFFYQEPGYLFVNSFDNNVRPIGASRSYADAHLAAAGSSENSVVVYRRRPTAEIELQHALITISTVFGIGISLAIEGAVLALVALARRGDLAG